MCVCLCVCGLEWSQLCGTHCNDSQSELIQNQSGFDGTMIYPGLGGWGWGGGTLVCVYACGCVSVYVRTTLNLHSALHLLLIAQMVWQNLAFDVFSICILKLLTHTGVKMWTCIKDIYVRFFFLKEGEVKVRLLIVFCVTDREEDNLLLVSTNTSDKHFSGGDKIWYNIYCFMCSTSYFPYVLPSDFSFFAYFRMSRLPLWICLPWMDWSSCGFWSFPAFHLWAHHWLMKSLHSASRPVPCLVSDIVLINFSSVDCDCYTCYTYMDWD